LSVIDQLHTSGRGLEELYVKANETEVLLEVIAGLADLESARSKLLIVSEVQDAVSISPRDSLKAKVLKIQLAIKLGQKVLPISLDFLEACLEDAEVAEMIEDTLTYLSIEQPQVFETKRVLKSVVTKVKSVFSVICIVLNLILSENTRLFFNNEHGLTEADSAKVREFMETTHSMTSKPLKFRSETACQVVVGLLCEDQMLLAFLARLQGVKAAETTATMQQRLALALFILAEHRSTRPHMVATGCLSLLNSFEHAEAVVRGQALARVLITTDPRLLSLHLCTGLVLSLLRAISESKHELTEYECALALTNLASAYSEVRDLIVSKKGWKVCIELLFSDNEALRLEGLNLACNLASSNRLYEEEMKGVVRKDIPTLIALLLNCSLPIQVAASSVLANLSFDPSYRDLIRSRTDLLEFLGMPQPDELSARVAVLKSNLE
jgi:hypothetical protein